MRLWTIKKDGYALGEARGKFEAVTRLVRHMSLNNEEGQWTDQAGFIRVKVNKEGYQTDYTIERTNNE